MNGIELLVVFAPQDFRDQELLCAIDVLTRRGFTPVLASTRSGTTRGMVGTELEAAVALDWVSEDTLDAIVVIGGTGAQVHLWHHPTLKRLVQTVHGRGGLVGAGTSAAAVLAQAGVLQGREVAGFDHPDTLHELRDGGARPQDRAVVVSGSVVTLSDESQATAWLETIAGMLEGFAAVSRASNAQHSEFST
ncbi:MAG: DJ-1/PfpI family protein [Myxococcota bacterium]